MVHEGCAYVGHMFSRGVTVLDVRDPREPHPVGHLPAAPGIWNLQPGAVLGALPVAW